MRRSIPVLTATAGGLALLANFHTNPASTVSVGAPSPTGAPGPSGSGPTAAPATTTTAPGGTRVIDGPIASNDYGDVQVRVT